jgi:hypothetical protein
MTMRILVIEDEARTADFIEKGLKEKGQLLLEDNDPGLRVRVRMPLAA